MTYNGRLNARMLARDFPDADWRNILAIAIKWGKGDETFTQDLMQSAVVKVYEIGRGKNRPLYTFAAKNAMRDVIQWFGRRTKSEQPMEPDPEVYTAAVGLAEPIRELSRGSIHETDENAIVDQIENRLIISQAFSKMDDEERSLIGAISVGLKVAEAAETFGWSVPKTKSKLHRIQCRMRNLLSS